MIAVQAHEVHVCSSSGLSSSATSLLAKPPWRSVPVAGRNERGGSAQSAGAAAEGSQLAFFLVSQTMWGAMSTKLCKTIAEHARRDIEYANLQHNGFIFKDLNALAYL